LDLIEDYDLEINYHPRKANVVANALSRRSDVSVVEQDPPTGVDRQHKSQEAQSLYPSALQLTRSLRLRFVGRAI
jgi:hypothetical protein